MTLPPGQHDHVIKFKWDNCRGRLPGKIRALAAYRYKKMLKARAKRGNGGDPDYEP